MNKIGILVGFLCCIFMGTANASSITISGLTNYDFIPPIDYDGHLPITSQAALSVSFGALNINDDVNADPNIYEFTNVFMDSTVNFMEFVGGYWQDLHYNSSGVGNYLRIEDYQNSSTDWFQIITVRNNLFVAQVFWRNENGYWGTEDAVASIQGHFYINGHAEINISPFTQVPEPNTLVLLLAVLLVLFFVNHFKINRSNR